MKFKDIKNRLLDLGWKYKNIDGDKSFIRDIDDIQIQLLPYLDRLDEDTVKFSFLPSVSILKFTEIQNYLMEEALDFVPLVSRFGWCAPAIEKGAPSDKFHEISFEIFDFLLKESIEWAKYQNIDKALEYYANLPTNSPGSAPLGHLAALIIRKEVQTVLYYKNRFDAGDNLGFVPYITADVIAKAANLICQKQPAR